MWSQYFTCSDGHYRGMVEPGKKCLVPRDGKLTYLVSEVEVNQTDWISRDRGFDQKPMRNAGVQARSTAVQTYSFLWR